MIGALPPADPATSAIRPGELRTLVARGGAWMFGLRLGEQVLRSARLLVLTRLLAPTEFGSMGLALLTLATLATFSEPGFQAALIQRKRGVEDLLNTAWTTSVLRGAGLCLLLVLGAPTIAEFFGAPEARRVMQVLALSLLLQGFQNVATLLLQKELAFRKQFTLQLSVTLVEFLVSIAAAWFLRSVWALVLGTLAGDLTRLVAGYWIRPFRPRFEWKASHARELWGYGRWVLGLSVMVFLSTQGDDLVVGKLLGATMLAYYQIAYRISNVPATEFARLVTQVSFPAFARYQDDLAALRRNYLKVLQFSTFFAFPLAVSICVLAEELTRVLLGPAWLPMVPAMRILAAAALCRSITGPGPLFMALGRPDLRVKLQLLSLSTLIVLIVPFTLRWGIAGTALASAIRVALDTLISLGLVVWKIGCPVAATLRAVLFPLAGALGAGGIVLLVKSLGAPAAGLGPLLLHLALLASVYLALSRLWDVLFAAGGWGLLREQWNALTGRA